MHAPVWASRKDWNKDDTDELVLRQIRKTCSLILIYRIDGRANGRIGSFGKANSVIVAKLFGYVYSVATRVSGHQENRTCSGALTLFRRLRGSAPRRSGSALLSMFADEWKQRVEVATKTYLELVACYNTVGHVCPDPNMARYRG